MKLHVVNLLYTHYILVCSCRLVCGLCVIMSRGVGRHSGNSEKTTNSSYQANASQKPYFSFYFFYDRLLEQVTSSPNVITLGICLCVCVRAVLIKAAVFFYLSL